MVAGGLLHQLHPCPPLHLAESPFCTRSALPRLPFPPKRYSATLSKRGLLQPILRSIQCVKQEEQAGSDGEVVEWVNKAVRDPMVELDPVTVFRRIVADRCAIARASLAMARAKEEEANLALQTTSTPPFILGSKWTGKSTIAIATALVLLAVAAALYYLRSRKDRYEATELSSADAKDTLQSSVDGRRKLVKDTIKAPESVLTAMALGAASVSRPKGHVGSTHDILHASNANVVESKRPQGSTHVYPIVSTITVEDMESDLHGIPTFGQVPYSSSIAEELTPLEFKNVGVDVTEGPWFGQGVNDAEMLAPVEELESEKTEELEAEDVLIVSQALPLSNETTALPAVEQLVNEISVGEIEFEAPVLTGLADGEFHGEVVVVSDQPTQSKVQVLEFKIEESQIDGVLAESSTTAEKLEQIIKEESIISSEAKGAADDTVCPEQNIVIGSSAVDLSNGQFDQTDSESDCDNDENIKHHGVEQSFTATQDDGVSSLEASDSKGGFEEVQVAEGYLLVLNSDSLSTKGQENINNLVSDVDQTLEGSETELDDVLDGVSSSANAFYMGQIVEDEEFVNDTEKESSRDGSASPDPNDCQNLDSVAHCSPVDAAVQASEEDSREDNKKALEAAVPAITIGVGTVGALLGVAGGLQVVGFAALASFISHDFFWAQSRESLWQEMSGITDRQKLSDFLAKRNIMRIEREKSSL